MKFTQANKEHYKVKFHINQYQAELSGLLFRTSQVTLQGAHMESRVK